jgi:hypothetical protein
MIFKKLLSFVLFFLIVPLHSQSGSNYTRLGLGDIEYSYSSRRLGMGQLGVSVADVDFINSLNPAGWYLLSKTRIEFGINYNGLFISNDNLKRYSGEAELSGFTFAFPISTDYGISAAVGFIPFSNVSYLSVQNFEFPESPSDNYKLTYEGTGGLSKIFIGTSYKFPFNTIVGATLDYYFGSINYNSKIEFSNTSSFNAEYIKTYRPKGLGTTAGFITPDLSSIFNSSAITDFRFGGSLNYFFNLNADTLLTSNSVLLTDTIAFAETEIEIPPRINLGASLVLNNEYLLSLDYSFQFWSRYKFAGSNPPGLRDAFKISSGFEYRPDRKLGVTFWEQIIWRAGLSFEQTQYEINNEGINQYSISGGFSIPIGFENTLDIGLQYALRGTTRSNLLKENIIRMNFGISLGETWFIRREN